jgi:hypothetical protein
MRVSQASDFVTHAVVGGQNEAIEFGISDSPEFFHILSSTLYSDKMLAVVREVMCNAWDAHIEAKRADVPLEVTLTSTKLIIKDSGNGIPRSEIGVRYGVYGQSTRTGNKKVNGGFGLGCKAPFAYQDHFEVTSCNGGTKTIYQMTLSAAQVNGKPSIIPIVDIPTDETGLTVSIDVKDSYRDEARFKKLIMQIATLGEMKVKLNGALLPTIPFSKAVNSFMVVRSDLFEGRDEVKIRCGNVVYPLGSSPEYATQLVEASEFVRKLNNRAYYDGNGTWTLVLQAEPDSISFTPSRESLSLTPHTIEAVINLLDNFHKVRKQGYQTIVDELLLEKIDKLWLTQDQAQLFRTMPFYPKTEFQSEVDKKKFLGTARDIAVAALGNEMPSYEGFAYRERLLRLDALIKGKIGNTQLLKSFRRELVRFKKGRYTYQTNNGKRRRKHMVNSTWLHKRLLWPTIRAMEETSDVPAKNFYLYAGQVSGGKIGDQFTPVKAVRPSQPQEYFPYLRGVVVISHNRQQIIERAWRFPMWKPLTGVKGSAAKCFAYVVPRNKEKVEAAVKLFNELGYSVIDITTVQDFEPEEYKKAPAKYEPTPRKKGVPMLSAFSIRSNYYFQFDVLFSEIENDERIEKPDAYIKVSRTEMNCFAGFNYTDCFNIHKFFGDRIGVINSVAAESKLIEAGIPDLHTWLRQQVAKEFKNNPEIKAVWESDPDRIEDCDYKTGQLIDAIIADAELRKKFKIPAAAIPSERVKAFMGFWGSMRYYTSRPELEETSKLVKSWSVSKELIALKKSIDKSKLISIIDSSGLVRLLKDKDAKIQKSARDLFTLALEG